MTFTLHECNIRTIRPGDKKWLLNDGFVIAPRAGLEISCQCPDSYIAILQTAIDNSWIIPVAHVYGKELTMDTLR